MASQGLCDEGTRGQGFIASVHSVCDEAALTEHVFRAYAPRYDRDSGSAPRDERPAVLAAMGEVARERFVPAGRSPLAYADCLVALKPGRDLNSPMALGRLLSEAAPRAGEKALVIGAATGYAAP